MRPIARDLARNSMFVILIVVVVLFTYLTDGVLVRSQNISNLIVQNGYILILAVGMVMVIVAGHIDLSVGSVAGFIGAVSGVLATSFGLPWGLVIVLSIALGALVGAWQGFWIAYVGVPSFIVTLAGMLTFRGLTLVVLGTGNIGSFSVGYRALGNGFLTNLLGEYELDPVTLGMTILVIGFLVVTRLRARAAAGRFGIAREPLLWMISKLALMIAIVAMVGLSLASYKGIPIILIVLGLLAIFYSLLTQRTAFGRHIFAIGGNRRAAQLSGIDTRRVDLLLFVNMGALAALAGLVFTARLNLASPAGGNGFELEAITAAFVGGAAVQGGVGTVGGAIIGGLIIGVLNNGMSILGLGSEWQQTVKGLVLLLAVAFDIISKRRSSG